MPTIESLSIEVGVNSESASSGLDKLAESLSKVKAIAKGGLGLTAANNQLKKLVTTLNGAETTAGADKLTKIGSAMSSVKTASAAATKSMSGFAKAANTKVSASGSAIGSALRFGAIIGAVRLASRALSAGITASNAYVENLNLFTVAMGEYADQALAYANQVQSVIGIDASEWIRNQGIFKQIASGFGLAEEKAYTFSKGLTQVAYDIASFYNISTSDAMQKVQAGIAGEIEPMRRLGYAIDQNTLQQVANAHGINLRVTQMNQAQKAELRYVAIMEQSKNAIGDMSRTINTSANQLRILKSQVSQLARAFGNLLIPMVNAVLPVLINFVNVVARVLNTLARLFGFVLPSIDYSGMSGGLSDTAEAAENLGSGLGSAGGAAKELKRTLLGFDELNVLQDQAGGGGGGGGGAGGLGGLDDLGLNLEDYDFLGGLESVLGALTPIQSIISAIGTGLLGWVVSQKFLNNLGKMNGLLSGILAIALTMATTTVMVALVYKFDKKFQQTGNPTYLLADAISTFFGSMIAYRLLTARFGQFAGWTGTAIVLGISAITSIIATLEGVNDDGVSWKTLGNGLVAAVKGAAVGMVGAKLLGASMVAGAAIGFGVTAGITLLLTGLIVLANSGIKAVWGTRSLTETEIEQLAHELVDQDINALITVGGAQIEEGKTFKTNFKKAVQTFQDNLGLLQIYNSLNVTPTGDIEVTDLTSAQVSQLNSDIQSVVTNAQGLLSSVSVQVKTAVQLFESDEEGQPTELGSGIINSVSAVTLGLTEQVTSLGAQLGEAYSAALVDGVIDVKEQEIIDDLLAKFNQINEAIAAYTEEYNWSKFVAESGLASLDKESFMSVWAEYQTYLAEQEQALRDQAVELQASLRGSIGASLSELETYEVGSEEYTTALTNARTLIGQLAELTGVEVPEGALETPESILSFFETLPMLDVDAYIAEAFADLQTKGNEAFLTALQDIFGTPLSEGIDTSLITADIASVLSGAFENLGDADTSTIVNMLQDSVGTALSSMGFPFDVAETLGVTNVDLLSEDVKTQLYDQLVSVFGEDKATEVSDALGLSLSSSTSTALDTMQTTIETEGADVTSALSSVVEDASLEVPKGFNELGDTLGKVGKSAKTTATQMKPLNTELGTAYTSATELDDVTATPTINLDDNASSGIKKVNSLLGGIKGTVNTKLNVTASVSGSAGSISNSLATILSSSSPSRSSAFKNLYRYSLMASGGIPTQGTMFLAGEAGPEIVGQVGNKTGVANEAQIADIIAAEMARQGGAGGDNSASIAQAVANALDGVEVVCDGDRMGRIAVKAINKYQRRTGRVELQLGGA